MMSVKTFWILSTVLALIGIAVAPLLRPQDGKRRNPDGEVDITKVLAKDLPVPDPNKPKFILTDDDVTITKMLNDGNFVAKFKETAVRKFEEGTAFRITVQNHWNNKLMCVQLIRVYEEIPGDKSSSGPQPPLPTEEEPQQSTGNTGTPAGGSSGGTATGSTSGTATGTTSGTATGTATGSALAPPTNKRTFKKPARDQFLAKCEGGYDMRTHTRYRFGFANAIHFFGANRMILKVQDPIKGYVCHERSYTIGGRKDKEIEKVKCEKKIERIYTWQGAIKNFFWNIVNHPGSLISGKIFNQK